MKELIKKLCVVLTLLNKVVPKKKNQIFFYSNLGFRDNVEAMFRYCIQEGYQEKFTIVCATNDHEKLRTLKEENPERYKNVQVRTTKGGVFAFLRSAYAFYCFGKYPIKPAKNQMVFNLWHGMPLKRIGNMIPETANIDYEYFSHLLATSEFYGEIMQKCFHCDRRKIVIAGQPRNDDLFQEPDQRLLEEAKGYDYVIAFLPTYRNDKLYGDERDDFPIPFLNPKEAEELNDYLKEVNGKIFLKLHPLQAYGSLPKYSNIEVFDEEELQKRFGSLYRMLTITHALITDYSSIYFDYLLLDRPMAFAIKDIRNYEQARGFVFERPLDYMPGQRVRNYQELKGFLQDLVEGRDPYLGERHRVNDFVNYYKDGKSSERIAKRYLPDPKSL